MKQGPQIKTCIIARTGQNFENQVESIDFAAFLCTDLIKSIDFGTFLRTDLMKSIDFVIFLRTDRVKSFDFAAMVHADLMKLTKYLISEKALALAMGQTRYRPDFKRLQGSRKHTGKKILLFLRLFIILERTAGRVGSHPRLFWRSLPVYLQEMHKFRTK